MDVDALMDHANLAVEGIFGRTVSYVPPGGGPAVEFAADYQRAAKQIGFEVTDQSTSDPRLDVRKQTLDDLGLTVEQGGIVSFNAEGEAQVYKITDVQPTAVGSLILVLGRVSS